MMNFNLLKTGETTMKTKTCKLGLWQLQELSVDEIKVFLPKDYVKYLDGPDCECGDLLANDLIAIAVFQHPLAGVLTDLPDTVDDEVNEIRRLLKIDNEF
jgi:hypothetical protein